MKRKEDGFMLKRKICRVIAGVMVAILLMQGSAICASAETFLLSGDDYEYTGIEISESSKTVATVSGSGKTATVKAVGKGKATITATTSNGKKITCKFTVK
jgi:hypothetical protein